MGHHNHHRNDSSDVECGGFGQSFSNVAVRNAFIRKVYGILAMQFAFTTLVIVLIRHNKVINEYFTGSNGSLFYIGSIIGYFVVYFILMCCESCRRTVPNNYILLMLFTFFMSIMVGVACLQYDLESLMFAAGLTFIICLLVSVFSSTTSFDFTKWTWIMFIVLMVFFLAGIAMMFIQSRTIQIIYAAVGVAIFTIYLAIDTQMIIGGGRENEISTEEYIFAVILLYIDIMNLFLLILRLISLSRD